MASSTDTYYLNFVNTGLLITKTVEVDVTILPRRCVIATAAYGSELAAPVQFLRDFRDNEVSSTYVGTEFLEAFNAWYYSWAPSVANAEMENIYLRDTIRVIILPLLGSLLISSEIFHWLAPINREGAVFLAGTLISVTLGLVYLSPLALVVSYVSKRRVTSKTYVYVAMFGVALTSLGTIPQGTLQPVQILTSLFVIEMMLIAATEVTRRLQSSYRR